MYVYQSTNPIFTDLSPQEMQSALMLAIAAAAQSMFPPGTPGNPGQQPGVGGAGGIGQQTTSNIGGVGTTSSGGPSDFNGAAGVCGINRATSSCSTSSLAARSYLSASSSGVSLSK